MSSSAGPTPTENEHALKQVSATDTGETLPDSAGGIVNAQRMAVHDRELQKALDQIKRDREDEKAALAAAMRELREKRKEATSVKTMKGS